MSKEQGARRKEDRKTENFTCLAQACRWQAGESGKLYLPCIGLWEVGRQGETQNAKHRTQNGKRRTEQGAGSEERGAKGQKLTANGQ